MFLNTFTCDQECWKIFILCFFGRFWVRFWPIFMIFGAAKSQNLNFGDFCNFNAQKFKTENLKIRTLKKNIFGGLRLTYFRPLFGGRGGRRPEVKISKTNRKNVATALIPSHCIQFASLIIALKKKKNIFAHFLCFFCNFWKF